MPQEWYIADSMRIALFVHGFVQGVGYRHFVKKNADVIGVKGMVRNLEDGSVLVIANGDADTLAAFERSISVSTEYGVWVMHIDRVSEDDPEFPKEKYDVNKFSICR